MDSSDITTSEDSEILNMTPSERGINDSTLVERTGVKNIHDNMLHFWDKAYLAQIRNYCKAMEIEVENAPYMEDNQRKEALKSWEWYHNDFIKTINNYKDKYVDKFKTVQNRPINNWKKVKRIPLCYDKFVEAYGKKFIENKYRGFDIEIRYMIYNRKKDFNKDLYNDYLNYDLEAIKKKKRIGLYKLLEGYLDGCDN